MKKLIFVLVSAMLLAGAIKAQPGISSIDINEEPSFTEKKFSAKPHARVKAERDFVSAKKKAEAIKWYEVENGFFVYYTENGIRGRRFYDERGKFVYNILFVDEKNLPYEIKVRVKSVYYFDYKITNAWELVTKGETIYLVRLTDDKTWKTVRIWNDEMEVIEDFNTASTAQ